ncbi:DUF1648 domain-containing protein [Sphaerimonospora cavernae]|uniref:DUF1648 domain-containing protein n=1 Tax=Sphaerimonospora cavernae TaxID=1740611 RepID=A0ABV6U2W6_9ACTN
MTTDESTESTDSKRRYLRRGLIGTAVALLASAGVSIWGWIHIPEDARIPTHWNGSGTADGFSGKAGALVELPLVMLAVSALFAALPFLIPRQEMAAGARFMTAVWMGLLLLFTGGHSAIIINATGGEIPVVRVAFAGVGILYLLLGNYLPKIRGGSATGTGGRQAAQDLQITPRAQRMAGRMFAGLGLIMLAFGFVLPVPALTAILVVGTVATGLTVTFHSWWSLDPRQN